MMDTLRTRMFRSPPQGWLSLLLVATLAVTVAWSLDDAALVLGQRDWTDFLAWMALGGVAIGFIGARVGWNRPLAHLIGAVFAALIVPILVGRVMVEHGSLASAYQATADSVVNAVIDFAVRGLPVTREYGHYLLALGLLCWANGMFAASAVFRQSRPIGPIIVLGAVLVANMSATLHDQIWLLVLYSMASLFLLIRLHALEERATWIRRRIGDPAIVGSLYLRGGTVFIALAVFLALTLTASARSAPLAGFWEDAKPALVDISQWLQRIIPAAPDSKTLGVPSFGGQVVIGGLWSTSNDPALQIKRDPGNDDHLYWRASTYDTFTLRGWVSSAPKNDDRPAGTDLLDGTLDAIPSGAARTIKTFQVTPQTSLFRVAFDPIDPISIDRDSTLTLVGAGGSVQSIGIDGHGSYTVTAAIPKIADIAGGLTENRLRAAGTNYPLGILARYMNVPKDAMGPEATQLYNDIIARAKAAGQTTPFDIATAIVKELQSSKFQYRTNVLGVCDHDPSIVECFAAHKVGFCEHYASTMAIFLRKASIPSRLVEGFLPGSVDPATGIENITTGGAHAWVEVYFPGYGWQMFDPTGGGLSKAPELPEGTFVPLPSATAVPSFPRTSINPGDEPRHAGGSVAAGPTSGGSSGGPLVIIAIALIASFALLAVVAWRRGPRSASTPEGVYASVTSLARRFGFGPRPTQTAFEYAAALGDVLPSIRPELQTVAAAKVEVAYGRRELGEDRIRALRASYRRLRLSMLRLAFRRGERRKMRKG